MLSKKITKITTIILSVLVLWMLLFGLSQMIIDMNMMDAKANCPFGGHSIALCQMNPMEHIQEWQSMFTILPAKNYLSLSSALLVFLVLLALGSIKTFTEFNQSRFNSRTHYFYLNRFALFNQLRELFSSGILNPKIF